MITKFVQSIASTVLYLSSYAAMGIYFAAIFGVTGWILGSAGHSYGYEGLFVVSVPVYIAVWISLLISEDETAISDVIFFTMGTMRYAVCCGLIGTVLGLSMSNLDGNYVLVECYVGFMIGMFMRISHDSQFTKPIRRYAKRMYHATNSAIAYGAGAMIPFLFLAFINTAAPITAVVGLAIGVVFGFRLGYRKAISKERPDN